MRPLKFRQRVINDTWHYWGFIGKDVFVGPASLVLPSYQFTGLCDKKEKEGYHKDICRIPAKVAGSPHDVIAVIEWDEGCFYFRIPTKRGDKCSSIINLPYSEIIGNVFQNKDLLEK